MRRPLVSRRDLARVVSLGALVALAACSNNEGSAYTPYVAAPPSSRGAGGGLGTGGGFDAGTPSGTVLIEILAPGGGSTLSSNAAADVSARVSIVSGTDLVDPASVRMTLTATGLAETLSSVPLVGPVGGTSEYRGKLSLAGLKTGAYRITVTARSTTGALGSQFVDVQVDAGPLITVLSPVPGRSYKETLFVQVAVDAGDVLGPATDIQATIAGMPVALVDAGQPNQHRAVFSLTMPQALEGEQIFTISAKNKNGTRAEIRFVFVVDVRGPTITQTKPIPGEIVGGVIKIQATVADPAGLNESSIQVLVGDKTTPQFRLALTPEKGGVYSVLFDTRLLTSCSIKGGLCIVRPTVSFRAADLLGNEANNSYEIALDNNPPIADLDPPNIRDSKLDLGLRCSHEFDPLDHDIYSGDAPNDLCAVPQLFDLRARIQDTGNTGAGIKAIPISTVDMDRTAVYVLDATTINGEPQALVVDTDGDGFCDAVNPKLETTTTPLTNPRQALKIRMRPVPPGGVADFSVGDPNPPTACLPGKDLEMPEDLCAPGPQPTIAIRYANELPAIWTIEPSLPDAGKGYCFGSQLDTFANNITSVVQGGLAGPLGWKCIAVVTADKAGNTSTSAPLRVYLRDYTYGGSGEFCTNRPLNGLPPVALPANAGPPPNCTGTFDKMTGVVSPKACQTKSFKLQAGQSEVCYKGNCDFCLDGICR